MMKDPNFDIHSILKSELESIQTSDTQKELIYEIAKETHVIHRRKMLHLVLIAIVLLSITCAALAATGAFEAIKSIWENSFSRMNTTGEMNIVDAPDVSDFLDQLEKDDGVRKEDLYLSTVPEKDDITLEEALNIAKNAIMEKYGTPEDELDAMGVYPEFWKTPNMENQLSSWTIFYTSIMDEDIFEDHFFLAPGEYRVYINSPSGEVTYCGYYNDEFWPKYAIRCWEHGSKDYVYEEAKKPAFRQLLTADQEYFLSLFQKAGYDISSFQQDQ